MLPVVWEYGEQQGDREVREACAAEIVHTLPRDVTAGTRSLISVSDHVYRQHHQRSHEVSTVDQTR
jgi:hypothetical protein